ncbi:MAG: hypothetical protein NUV76_05880, partial [Candidatus Kuenenia sp.]|nr:hypothetical protein [Candidatus Kuenenia sp.]
MSIKNKKLMDSSANKSEKQKSETISNVIVIASDSEAEVASDSEAISSLLGTRDCFVAPLLAM